MKEWWRGYWTPTEAKVVTSWEWFFPLEIVNKPCWLHWSCCVLQLFLRWTSAIVRSVRSCFSSSSKVLRIKPKEVQVKQYLFHCFYVWVFFLSTLTGAICKIFNSFRSWQGNFYLNWPAGLKNLYAKRGTNLLVFGAVIPNVCMYAFINAYLPIKDIADFPSNSAALLLSLFKTISISLGHRLKDTYRRNSNAFLSDSTF